MDVSCPSLGILIDHVKGVVVNRHHLLWLDQFYGFQGIVRTHGVIVADGEKGQVDAFVADQGHVAK